MSKPKPKKEDIEARATESKDAKFRRIAIPRIKRIIYELERLENMTTQPTYEIFDVDAEKLLTAIDKAVTPIMAIYRKIADGESIKPTKKTEIGDIF